MEIVNSLNTNIIFSLAGCVTGVIGLFISLYSLFRDRFRLKIIFADTENWYFPKVKGYETYATNFQAIVRFNIINKSYQPISVYDLDVIYHKKYLRYEHYPYDDLKLLCVYEANNDNSINRKKVRRIPMDRQHQFPIRLESHETYEGFLFIAYFPDVDISDPQISFTFKTTKRTFKTTHKLTPLFPKEVDNVDKYI